MPIVGFDVIQLGQSSRPNWERVCGPVIWAVNDPSKPPVTRSKDPPLYASQPSVLVSNDGFVMRFSPWGRGVLVSMGWESVGVGVNGGMGVLVIPGVTWATIILLA